MHRQTTPRRGRGRDAALTALLPGSALPRGPGVPRATALGHRQEMPNPPRLPSRGRARSLGLQEGWRRAPCAPQGRTSPVVAGSRHPVPTPRSPAPAAITCANTRAAPRDQRAQQQQKIITPRAKKLQIATPSPSPQKGEFPEAQHATWGASTGTGEPANRISKCRSLEIKKRWKRAAYRNSLLPEPSWLAGCTSHSPSIAMLPAAPACSHSTESPNPKKAEVGGTWSNPPWTPGHLERVPQLSTTAQPSTHSSHTSPQCPTVQQKIQITVFPREDRPGHS